MTYRINKLLLRVAMEDAAQEAAKVEIARQVLANDPPGSTITFQNMVVDMEYRDDDGLSGIVIDGVPVEWV